MYCFYPSVYKALRHTDVEIRSFIHFCSLFYEISPLNCLPFFALFLTPIPQGHKIQLFLGVREHTRCFKDKKHSLGLKRHSCLLMPLLHWSTVLLTSLIRFPRQRPPRFVIRHPLVLDEVLTLKYSNAGRCGAERWGLVLYYKRRISDCFVQLTATGYTSSGYWLYFVWILK